MYYNLSLKNDESGQARLRAKCGKPLKIWRFPLFLNSDECQSYFANWLTLLSSARSRKLCSRIFKDSERLKVLAFIYYKKIKIISNKFNLVQDTEEQLLNSSCGSRHDSRHITFLLKNVLILRVSVNGLTVVLKVNGFTPTYERYMYWMLHLNHGLGEGPFLQLACTCCEPNEPMLDWGGQSHGGNGWGQRWSFARTLAHILIMGNDQAPQLIGHSIIAKIWYLPYPQLC